jgi:Uma2 family endonuclease
MVVERPATGRAVTAPPLLTVEIISPSDHQRLADGRTRREGKLADYAANGLDDYLEVDLTVSPVTVVRYERHGDRLVEVDRATGTTPLRSPRPFVYSVVPADL